MRAIVAILAWLLATGPALAQAGANVPVTVSPPTERRPMPEDGVPEAEKLSFLAGYVDGDAPVRERRWALNRALRLAAQKDQETLTAWRAREGAFYRREAARIDVAALPTPARPCDSRPDAESPLLACAQRAIDYDIGNLYEIAAEAARLEGDRTREMALREAAAIFMGGANPHFTYWTNLAARAAEAGEDETARRVCSYLRATQYRDRGPDPFASEKHCQAYAAFRAQRWSDWLALRAPAFAATTPTSTEALLSYCVAFARTGARAQTREACDKASAAVAAHSAHLAEAAARPDGDALAMQIAGGASGRYADISDQIVEESARREAASGSRVSMAVVVADLWAAERARLDAAISACRGAAETAGDDEGCAFPDNVRTLNITFRSRGEALSDILRRLGPSARPARRGAAARDRQRR